MVDEFRGEIQSGIESLCKAVAESENEERAIDKQHKKFLADVESVHSAVIKQATELKQVQLYS